jgi:hypothetical protein
LNREFTGDSGLKIETLEKGGTNDFDALGVLRGGTAALRACVPDHALLDP